MIMTITTTSFQSCHAYCRSRGKLSSSQIFNSNSQFSVFTSIHYIYISIVAVNQTSLQWHSNIKKWPWSRTMRRLTFQDGWKSIHSWEEHTCSHNWLCINILFTLYTYMNKTPYEHKETDAAVNQPFDSEAFYVMSFFFFNRRPRQHNAIILNGTCLVHCLHQEWKSLYRR